MTKVAIWCRHETDNLIGIGKNIPWRIPSDIRFFTDVVRGQNLVLGRKTYDAVPMEILSDSVVWVLTSDKDYEPRRQDKDMIITDIRRFKEFEADLYIGGGAAVYGAFFSGASKLLPDIVVDCVYGGKVNDNLTGERIVITSCIDVMKKKYIKLTSDYEKDGVKAALWVKKGEFVDQSVLKRLLVLLEKR